MAAFDGWSLLAAMAVDAWNTFGPVERYGHKNRVLDDWCERVGRDPQAVERTVGIGPPEVGDADKYVAAGASHSIVMVGHPYDLTSVEQLLAARG